MTSDFVIWGALAALTAVFIAASRWAGWDGQPASGPGPDRQVRAGVSAPGGPGAGPFSSPPPPGPDPFAEDVPRPGIGAQGEPATGPSPRANTGPGHPRPVIRTAAVQGVWLPLTAAYDSDDTLIDCLPRQCARREPARPEPDWVTAIKNAPIEDVLAGGW